MNMHSTPVKGGSTVIAFITDPDGYWIEVVQNEKLKTGSKV